MKTKIELDYLDIAKLEQGKTLTREILVNGENVVIEIIQN